MEIHVITDGKQTVKDVVKKILLIHEEVEYIHLREKEKTASEIMEIVSLLLKNGVPSRKLVINDRLDIALLNKIPNVHLPGHSLSIEKVKEFNSSLRVGRSIHSIQEAISCEKAGADYLLYGHIFETNCKADLTPRGVNQLAKICESVQIPVIAIGGIVPETIPKLSKVKASGVAVMSYVMGSDTPLHAIQKLKASLAEEGLV